MRKRVHRIENCHTPALGIFSHADKASVGELRPRRMAIHAAFLSWDKRPTGFPFALRLGSLRGVEVVPCTEYIFLIGTFNAAAIIRI